MIGALIGAICGIGEFMLLKKLTDMITSGDGVMPVGIVLLKIALLIVSMLLCAFIVPKQLIWAATSAAAVLIIACTIKFIRQNARERNKA